ncbi:MAG TPA: geranylgeranylglycerol-phosphate geranylgeranyltransferase [Chitinophagales bacterium]|nr:geranylgeranylglycerol-phosphate geranylgeranyltransferase [Chitinophagales bacterium]
MKKITGFLQLIRAGNLFIVALSLCLFYYLILVPTHHSKLLTGLLPFSSTEFVLFVISIVCVAAAGNIINDYFDFELDKEYKPERPLAQGLFSLDTAMYLHAGLAFVGIGIGFYLGYWANSIKIGYIYVICQLMLYVYSAFLKKVPLAGNVLIAALTGFVFVVLMLFELQFLRLVHFDNANYVLDVLLLQVKFYGGFAFLTNLAREIVKDIEDAEGDAAYNINTLPVQFGTGIAKAVVFIVLGVLLAALIFFLRNFWLAGAVREFGYLAVAVVLPLFVVLALLVAAKQKKDYCRISLLLKAVMLMGILSILAFYLFNKQ